MSVGDVHIAGPDGWPLCGSSSPLRGYTASSPSCRECEIAEWKMRQRRLDRTDSSSAKTFRIVGGGNSYGLSRDGDIISSYFVEQGWELVEGDDEKVKVIVHLERIKPYCMQYADVNIVVPNPEWWCAVGNVSVADMNFALCHPSVTVWAKTRDSERIFRNLGAQVEYISFRSHDRLDSSNAKEKSFLHVAGVGPNKRTERLVEMWDPSWPSLTVTTGIGSAKQSGNVRVIVERLTDEALRTLQNRHFFHIYPSRYEGFGHAQWEGLSCGALVLTNNGPPFNEHNDSFLIIDSERNGGPEWNPMVSWSDITFEGLRKMVVEIQRLSLLDLVNSSERSRSKWEANRDFFEKRIRELISRFPQ